MIKYISLFCLLIMANVKLTAQEISATVTINTPKLQTADPKIFETLKTALQDFLNNQKWTDDVFEQNERIKVQIQLTIKEELSATSFKADMAIQAVRPVFNSTYETVILNHLDKDVSFAYEQYQPLQYSKNNYVDNLTAIFSFYAYIILGLDYDSFSPFGGEQHFQQAQEIYNNVPSGIANQDGGWQQKIGVNNRYWMIENALSPKTRPYRQGFYTYHRLGLDAMADAPDAGRAKITAAIDDIDKVSRANLNVMALTMFANAKASELIEIFKQATSEQKSKVYQLMTRIDAANAPKYLEIGL